MCSGKDKEKSRVSEEITNESHLRFVAVWCPAVAQSKRLAYHFEPKYFTLQSLLLRP
jgi:hypothetical protein